MAELSDIKTQNWSLSIKKQGEIVEDLQDIDQCLTIILLTQRGSDPTRPTFGVDLLKHIDQPSNRVIQSIVPDITDQVQRWETRAKLKSVVGTLNKAGSWLTITVTWTYFDQKFLTKVKYGIN